MKVLQSTKRGFGFLGFYPKQSITPRKYPSNRKNVVAFFILCLGLISSIFYFFYEANSFQEYALSAYTSATLTLAIVFFIILGWKIQSIFELIFDAEKMIDESEFGF